MKFLPSLTGTMSGSMGGCTASHNRGGMYFRNRVVPTDPNTGRQNAVRGYLTAAVNAWTEILTAAQREAWENYALNTPMTDTLGSTLILTGQQAFIKTHVVRYQLAGATIAAAPTDFNTGQPIAAFETTSLATQNQIGIDMAGTALSNTATLMAAAPAAGTAIMQLGPPINASRNFFKGPYQLASFETFAAAAATIPFNNVLLSMSQAEALVIGQFRAVRLRILYNDGRLSEAWSRICEVVSDVV
jgi:hypothetical protein